MIGIFGEVLGDSLTHTMVLHGPSWGPSFTFNHMVWNQTVLSLKTSSGLKTKGKDHFFFFFSFLTGIAAFNLLNIHPWFLLVVINWTILLYTAHQFASKEILLNQPSKYHSAGQDPPGSHSNLVLIIILPTFLLIVKPHQVASIWGSHHPHCYHGTQLCNFICHYLQRPVKNSHHN